VKRFMTFSRWCSSFSLSCVLSLAGSARADDAAPRAQAVSARVDPVRERKAFAVVIGNNKSLGRRRPELHYADDDAARYFEILETMAPGRVFLLSDFDRDTGRLFPETKPRATAPSRKNLDAVGRRLAAEVQRARAEGHETEVYFVFAGHGDVERGEGFVELADHRLRSSELKAWLRAIPFTRAHVILDSCNSFFMLGVRKPGGRHFATSEDAARALSADLPNVGVFLSTSAEGEAFEWSEIQSGIFSHVVRSGLLGAADANADGSVSYLELSAFVDTATSEVKNPNMRPHVFARGPGAVDHTPIARLHSMSGVRRFALSDADSLRVRLRDRHGLPLLDAHTERARELSLALPEAWARGSLVERTRGDATSTAPVSTYAIPDASDTVTLAALTDVTPASAVRGPDETFKPLFAKPFGPGALASYVATRKDQPPPVYGVSKEDTQRMDLVLDQMATFERGRRYAESLGAIGFGVLITGAGIGVLHLDPDLTASEKTEARILGGALLGLGGLFTLGGAGALFARNPGEEAADEFRAILRAGGDPARAFAVADERLREIAKARRAERYAAGFFGSLFFLGSTTGFVWSEIAADEGDSRMGPRLGWGAGALGGLLMIADAALMDTPTDSLTRIWRDDPSLNQYQPKRRYQPNLTLSREGAFLSLSGEL
jgi:hypothetical protein